MCTHRILQGFLEACPCPCIDCLLYLFLQCPQGIVARGANLRCAAFLGSGADERQYYSTLPYFPSSHYTLQTLSRKLNAGPPSPCGPQNRREGERAKDLIIVALQMYNFQFLEQRAKCRKEEELISIFMVQNKGRPPRGFRVIFR